MLQHRPEQTEPSAVYTWSSYFLSNPDHPEVQAMVQEAVRYDPRALDSPETIIWAAGRAAVIRSMYGEMPLI